MAQVKNLVFDDGDDFPYRLTITDGTNPINITGYTFYFTVKKNLDDTDAEAVFKKTVTTLTDPTNGIVIIDIDRTDTLNQTPGEYFYDIKWKTGDATPLTRTILEGKFTLTKSVTQVV